MDAKPKRVQIAQGDWSDAKQDGLALEQTQAVRLLLKSMRALCNAQDAVR